MDINKLEDGTNQIVIDKEDARDFEIVICGENGLYLSSDGEYLKAFRHSTLTPEDPYQPICQIPLISST